MPWLNGFLKIVEQHYLDLGQEPTGVVASWLRLRDDLQNKQFHEHSSANIAALLSLQTALSGTRNTRYVEELTGGLSKDQIEDFLIQSLINQPLKTSTSFGIEKDPKKLAKAIQSRLQRDDQGLPILKTALSRQEYKDRERATQKLSPDEQEQAQNDLFSTLYDDETFKQQYFLAAQVIAKQQ